MFELNELVIVSTEWRQAAVALRWWIAAAAAAAVAGGGTTAWWWRRRAARALAARCGVQVLPSQTFDPDRNEVLGAAPRLHRLPQLAGPLPRRARAVRIQMTASGGQLAYLLHAPRGAAHVLDLPMFRGVEVHVADASATHRIPRVRFDILREQSR